MSVRTKKQEKESKVPREEKRWRYCPKKLTLTPLHLAKIKDDGLHLGKRMGDMRASGSISND